MATPRPVVLIVMDGWGLGPDYEWNAVLRADTPVVDGLWATWPHTQLTASGEAVGLPAGQMGNSEVGHLNLGAGFVVYQWLTRIDQAIADGALLPATRRCSGRWRRRKRPGATLHLLGLVGDGGVHASGAHLAALLRLARDARACPSVAVHAFTDGRDTPPQSGARLHARPGGGDGRAIGAGAVATVSGRYYAMDRDKRWERVEQAYDALVLGEGAARRLGHGGDRGELRRRRHRRVHPADGDRARRPAGGDDRRRRRGHLLQLPRRPGARAQPRRCCCPTSPASRGARVPADLHFVTLTRYEDGLPVGGRLPAARRRASRWRAVVSGARPAAVPHRRDREVPARHLLLQRRPRGALPRRGAACWSPRRRSPPTTCSRR